jgi:hypothetical protein
MNLRIRALALASAAGVMVLSTKTVAAEADVVLPCPAYKAGNSWQYAVKLSIGPATMNIVVLANDGKKIVVGEKTMLDAAAAIGGDSHQGLVDLVNALEAREVHFRSLTDGIDTKTPAGRFFFHIMASLAQMESELIVERTRAGLAGGTPPRDVAENLGVSVPTLYRWPPASARP